MTPSTPPHYGLAHLSPPLADALLEALTTAKKLQMELEAAQTRYAALCEDHRAADRRLLALMKRAMVEVLGPEAVAYYHQQLGTDVPLGDFADDDQPF